MSTLPKQGDPAAPRWFGVVHFVLPLAVLLLFAGAFATQQTLWIDEVTQLSGISLGPVEVVRWLSGVDPDRFGVPSDRMPPISYWLGWAWSQAFGLTPLALRWLSITAVALALWPLVAAGRRIAGPRGGFVAAMLWVTTPNVLMPAAEIRAYPLFLLASATMAYALVGYAQATGARWRWLAAIGVVGVLATYTHFYGLVLSASVLAACLVLAWPNKRLLVGVVVTGVIVVLAASGLLPFLSHSVDISTVPTGSSPKDFVKLVYRLVGSPPLASSYLALGGAALATAVLGVLALLRFAQPATRALVLTLVFGLAATGAAGVVVRTFEVYKASYSLWMLPVMCLLLCSGLAVASARLRSVAAIAAAVVIASQGFGGLQLARHGDVYSHGPARMLRELVRAHPAAAVVYETDNWGYGYFPLVYDFGGDLTQYRPADAPGQVVALPHGEDVIPPTQLPHGELIVLTLRSRDTFELRRYLRGADVVPAPGALHAQLADDPRWIAGPTRTYVSFVAARATVWQRTADTMDMPRVE